MSTVADRVRIHRVRAAAGRTCVVIEVDEIQITEFLISARLLDPARADDRVAMARSLERLLEIITRGSP